MGGMSLTHLGQVAALEYVASTNISGPLAVQMKSQLHELPDESEIRGVQQEMR